MVKTVLLGAKIHKTFESPIFNKRETLLERESEGFLLRG
jgi:hypothetical protein